ncbi:MAG: Hsp70 family protein [Desulfobacteraceae bacterium]|nr:Hsp70 family protein [Desulfobacteraceae bacterium]
MSKSIGIDLGTTNSVGAVKKVHTEVLKNAEGDFITPSCITIKKKKLLFGKPDFVVGKNALEWMKQDPKNTVVAVKRLMGRNFQDDEVQAVLAEHKLNYEITRHSKGTENSLAVILNGKEFTPEEISSKILGKIRADSEKAMGDTVDYAVITVPAYFNDKQKHATRTAAAIAGLKIRRLLPEPTAAAVSFGVDTVRGDEAKTVFIFDFGGGTFDLSVLTISGGQFIEQGKGGDMWLGGEDIDQIISDYILAQTAKEYEIEDMLSFTENQDAKRKNKFIGELKDKVEKAKIRLSTEDEAHIEILGVLKDSDGDSIDIDVELDRDQFDKLIAPVVERIMRLTRKMLEHIHFTPDLIDEVLLVGGSSMIPSVIAAIKNEFGDNKVLIHERPMLAIAEGAAILSHRLSDTYECPKCGQTVSQKDTVCNNCQFNLEEHIIEAGVLDIVHSAAHDYYIRLENDERHLFVEKNTPLPCEKTETFKLVHSEQKLVHMKFYNIVNEEEESIGDLWLGIEDIEKEEDEKQDTEASLHVDITLGIDENNLVEVTATLKEHPEVQLSKNLSRGKADEKLFLALEDTINEANQKKYREYVMMDLTHRSLSVIRDINMVVDPETGDLNETMYEKAANKTDKAGKIAAEGQSPRGVINYSEIVLRDFAPAIPHRVRAEIRKSVKRLEAMEERGTFEENLKAAKDLNNVLNDKLGVVNLLMEIQKAGYISAETNPSKAPRFFQSINDILGAFKERDEEKAISIIQEVMPEVEKVVKNHHTKSGMIHKDITK